MGKKPLYESTEQQLEWIGLTINYVSISYKLYSLTLISHQSLNIQQTFINEKLLDWLDSFFHRDDLKIFLYVFNFILNMK